MLEAIRRKKENLFYTLILVAIIFVMLFVYGSGKSSNTKGEGAPVAWVNGESIGQREFQQVLQYRLSQYQQMLVIAFFAFLIYLPQLIYLKWVCGSFIFNSYVGERFYFNNPHILDGLFSFLPNLVSAVFLLL